MGLVSPEGFVLKEAYQYMKDVFRDNPDEPDDYYLGKWRDKRKERGDWVFGKNIAERRAERKEAGEKIDYVQELKDNKGLVGGTLFVIIGIIVGIVLLVIKKKEGTNIPTPIK